MSTVRVLIADDEDPVRRLVRATLGGHDRYEVVVARDGEEAVEVARRERPDLVFLDILMPRMDGYTACRMLKADPATAHIKIVMLTALAQERDRAKAFEAGADDYFTKPFSPTALIEKVEEVLKAKSEG